MLIAGNYVAMWLSRCFLPGWPSRTLQAEIVHLLINDVLDGGILVDNAGYHKLLYVLQTMRQQRPSYTRCH